MRIEFSLKHPLNLTEMRIWRVSSSLHCFHWFSIIGLLFDAAAKLRFVLFKQIQFAGTVQSGLLIVLEFLMTDTLYIRRTIITAAFILSPVPVLIVPTWFYTNIILLYLYYIIYGILYIGARIDSGLTNRVTDTIIILL